MIHTLAQYSPPVKPGQTGKFREDLEALADYLITRLLPYQFNFLQALTTTFNTGSQGVGAAIANAATITIGAFIHHITGAGAISTIQVPQTISFAGMVVLIADNAAGFSLATGGNIAAAKTVAQGFAALCVYDQGTKLWYPHAD